MFLDTTLCRAGRALPKLLLLSIATLIGSIACGQSFVHPGILHTQEDLDRMTLKVDAGEQPWLDGWNVLLASPYAQSGVTPNAVDTIIRGGTGDNVSILYTDVARAYQCALIWKVSGSVAHGDTARDILNDWSSTLTTVTGNADRYLAAGIFGYQLANASEMMRGYPGFNVAQMQNMLLSVFYYPLNERFLYGNEYGADHNDACITNYWANWDLCNMAAALAIGVFCDDQSIYDDAINYFKNGAGNGSIQHAVPFLHGADFGQWQESGRDQGHSLLGVGLMASFCEIAWHQGDDMYGWDDSRFRKGAEYVACYNLGNDVPFTTYSWGSGQSCAYNEHTAISSTGRGEYRPIWAMIYNHYANRKGQSVPYVAEMADNVSPEVGPGGHPTTFDQPGFGTLSYTLSPNAGTYRLRNRASGRYLDNLGSTANGATVSQWDGGASANQRWVISAASGYRKLICLTGAKALDSLGHTGNGSLCGQWDSSASSNQQWILQSLGNGYHKIVNRANGLCLDTGGDNANGAGMEFWGSGSSNNQQWALELVRTAGPRDGNYRLRNRASGKCLDNLGATADGDSVAQWAGGSSDNQRWVLSTVNGYRKLACVTGGKMLDCLGNTADGSVCGQWGNGGSVNQQWTLEYVGDGYYKVVNRANGKCLDTGGATSDGAVMEFWGSGSSYNQQWAIETY